jgi:anthranilate phosphoribosyltransferase
MSWVGSTPFAEVLLRDYLNLVADRTDLNSAQAQHVMRLLLSETASASEQAALLIAFRTKGETAAELSGFLTEMQLRMTPVACADSTAVDLCGTGGDHSESFNLSTAAALVAAAGGVTVAKHGNRAVSSLSGSADFLEALDISTQDSPEEAAQHLARAHFAFLFAPNFHPAMKAVAAVRKQLGVRTLFNLLGPLANPARVSRQLVGVFSPHWLLPIAQTLRSVGVERALVVHGDGGLDEISAAGETQMVELDSNGLRELATTPAAFGINKTPLAAIHGGTAAANATRFRALANGAEPQLAEWVIANAAPAFYLSGKARTLEEGGDQARRAIAIGALSQLLNALRTNSA